MYFVRPIPFQLLRSGCISSIPIRGPCPSFWIFSRLRSTYRFYFAFLYSFLSFQISALPCVACLGWDQKGQLKKGSADRQSKEGKRKRGETQASLKSRDSIQKEKRHTGPRPPDRRSTENRLASLQQQRTRTKFAYLHLVVDGPFDQNHTVDSAKHSELSPIASTGCLFACQISCELFTSTFPLDALSIDTCRSIEHPWDALDEIFGFALLYRGATGGWVISDTGRTTTAPPSWR